MIGNIKYYYINYTTEYLVNKLVKKYIALLVNA